VFKGGFHAFRGKEQPRKHFQISNRARDPLGSTNQTSIF
jgi:hypothetical protein